MTPTNCKSRGTRINFQWQPNAGIVVNKGHMSANPVPPDLDLTLRVGCRLSYYSRGPASIILDIQPRIDGRHKVLSEQLVLGYNLPSEAFTDSHGNLFWRLILAPGENLIRHDAIVAVSSKPDNFGMGSPEPLAPEKIPHHLLRYTLPSRYCDSDKLINFAWEKFGSVEHGWPRVQAISKWVHDNIEYRFMSGRPDLSAWDVLQRGYGVCRDFAHLAVALNRTFNVPSRYVTGHLPDIAFPDPEGHMDFHAYGEVYLGGKWLTTDARFHVPRIGLDAVDGAFSTIYGLADLSYFEVYAYQVPRGAVKVGDPVDLSLRLDNLPVVQFDQVS
jgi:transglutaminase-like putative cysteine protease